MINKVLQTIKKYNLIQENDTVVLGVSGGPDSICLLHVLNELKDVLKFKLVVAHINHMIRKEADDETKYVENICKKLGIECYIKKVDVIEKSNNEKIGTEEAGRKARYEFFEEIAKRVNANKIATAHNANDNAETVLMNIFRGTSTNGLKGIEPIRDNKFIRPIIECERFEIEEYCEENNLQPKIDMSNFENIYTRNKIRNVIIPQIKEEFNPNIIEGLNRLSNLAKEENEFVQRYVHNTVKELSCDVENLSCNNEEKQLALDLKKFSKLDKFIKNKVVIASIQKVLGNTQGITKIHIDDIVKLCDKNIGNKYLTPNKNIKVLVKDGKICFINISTKA